MSMVLAAVFFWNNDILLHATNACDGHPAGYWRSNYGDLPVSQHILAPTYNQVTGRLYSIVQGFLLGMIRKKVAEEYDGLV